jgi:hypothetical protein
VGDYVRLPKSVGGQEVRYELVELITVSPGVLPHNLVRDRILLELLTFANSAGLASASRRFGFR